jgi:hypothetical protein
MEYRPFARIIVKETIMPQTELDTPWLRFMLNAVLASLTIDPDRSVEDLTIERQAAAAMLGAFQVRNPIEAAFAAQAVTACHAAMECFRRAALMNASYPETRRVFATAMSLSRTALQILRAIMAGRPAVRTERRTGGGNPLAAVMAAAGQVNPMQSGAPANPPATRPATAGQVNPMQNGAPATPPAARTVAAGQVNPMQSGAPVSPAHPLAAALAAFGNLNPAKPGSQGGAPAGAASLLATALVALGWNDPMPSGTGQPIPASIAGQALTQEEREALACFASIMTQAA